MRERRLFSYSAVLLSGEVAGAGLNIATLALLARLLGPREFGDVAVVMAYTLTFDVLLNFQSWRTMIRYGSRPLAENRTGALMQVAKFCFVLDVASAGAAALLAVTVAFTVLPYLDVPPPELFALYCLALFANVVGHSTGVLRLLDRFTFLSVHKTLSALFRLTAVAFLALSDTASVRGAIVALLVAEVAGKGVILTRGLVALASLNAAAFLKVPLEGLRTQHPDIVSFSVYSNLNDAVLKVVQQVDVLVVSQLLNASDAGFFRLIKSLGSVFSMVGESIGQVIYPEMARRSTSREGNLKGLLRRLVPRLLVAAGVTYAAYFVMGRPLISYVFGESYVPIYGPSLLYMAGAAIGVAALPITPLFLVTGRQRALFMAYLAAGTAYLAVIVVGAHAAGLYGAAMALVGLYVTYLLVIAAYQAAGDRP